MKYERVAQWIRERIESGELGPGEKLETENELCGRFAMSRQTIRQALGLLEREGIVERRQGSGTYALGIPTPRRHMNVGVISTYIDDYIFPGIMRGMEQVLREKGYAMQVVFTYNRVENERQALQSFMDKDIDGLILEPAKSGLPNPNLGLLARLRADGLPIVLFDAYYPGLNLPYVALDDREAGRMATRHLIGAGHRQIAGIFQSDDIQGHLRYEGYVDALLEADIPLSAGRTFWFATEDIPLLFAHEADILGRLEGCTAVLAYNDNIAVRLLRVLGGRGIRCPEDMSIVGVDNSAQAKYAEPPLTSVEHPKERLGEAAARSLLRLLHGEKGNVTEIFAPTLRERASVRHL